MSLVQFQILKKVSDKLFSSRDGPENVREKAKIKTRKKTTVLLQNNGREEKQECYMSAAYTCNINMCISIKEEILYIFFLVSHLRNICLLQFLHLLNKLKSV